MNLVKIASIISSTKINLVGPFEPMGLNYGEYEGEYDLSMGLEGEMLDLVARENSSDEESFLQKKEELSNKAGKTIINYNLVDTSYFPGSRSTDPFQPDDPEDWDATVEIIAFNGFKMSPENQRRLYRAGIDYLIKNKEGQSIVNHLRNKFEDDDSFVD